MLFLDSEGNKEEKNRVLKLRHHLNDHSDVQRQEFHDMAQLVLLLLSRYEPATNQLIRDFYELQNDLETEILQLFGRVNCNAFSIANDLTNKTVGIGLYPDSALFNHDCEPNCAVSFKGREMLIHAIKDVNVGQELTVSYIELLQSTTRRQKELRESYFFDCECTRCKGGANEMFAEDWYLDGLRCAANKDTTCCEGVVVVEGGDDCFEIARCKMCGASRDSKEIHRQEKRLKDVEERKESNEHDKWEQYQHKWEIMTSRLCLHPRNTRVAELAREIGNFLSEASNLDLRRLARPFFQMELRAVEWLLPTMKLPSRGLLHFQLGKLFFEQATTLSRRNRAEPMECAAKHLEQALVVYVCSSLEMVCNFNSDVDGHVLVG
ncbi:hypothetical protein PsorP6_012028 [Peronosclerospora sorghi]|uniref:Uncharacterized protein n=1 Tax=Peronosclerospora sorghi TaxID=230839 RepID=A0ACC0WIP3_9STRA|nr:hypothetical protein PsorP6_012028 [Peronosclerospora sorghi]